MSIVVTQEEEPLLGADDQFVFSDRTHGQQEFLFLQQSVAKLGFDLGSIQDQLQDEDAASSSQDENVAFERGQKTSRMSVLEEIDRIQASCAAKGMKEWTFTWGLMNCLAIAYCFGAHPGQFWILYSTESLYWISSKFVGMWRAKPLCEAFYYLDFCWMMNFLGLALFATFCLVAWLGEGSDQNHWLDAQVRRQLFMAAYGIAVGPIFLASMTLPFVAFLFHDVNTMANLIIHILPSMLMYILKWQPETMQHAYPKIFNLQYMLMPEAASNFYFPIPFMDGLSGSVSRNAFLVYLAWFVPYTAWMLVIGLQLPRTSEDPTAPPPKYDTVFHSLWRGGPCELVGSLVWKRPKATSRKQSKLSDFDARDFLLYMVGHLLSCTIFGILLLARLCHWSRLAHGACLFLSVLICARRGAQRYAYYTTAMYGQRLRKHFEGDIDHEDINIKVHKKQS